MDLSQVDGWTRDTLEAEARRIGIKGCEYRTRTELVRLILRDRYGETWNAGRATLARGVRGLHDVRAALGAAIERTIVSVLSLPEPQGVAWVARRDVAAARAPTPDAPDARESLRDTAAPVEEDDGIAWLSGKQGDSLVRWHAGAAGIRRARAVLGTDGELAVRVVVVAPDAREFVRTQVIDHGPVDAAGEVPAAASVEGARRIAAVGLRAGERFVSIAHARA